MPYSHVNQVHLHHFVSGFFNSKLTYLLKKKTPKHLEQKGRCLAAS